MKATVVFDLRELHVLKEALMLREVVCANVWVDKLETKTLNHIKQSTKLREKLMREIKFIESGGQ